MVLFEKFHFVSLSPAFLHFMSSSLILSLLCLIAFVTNTYRTSSNHVLTARASQPACLSKKGRLHGMAVREDRPAVPTTSHIAKACDAMGKSLPILSQRITSRMFRPAAAQQVLQGLVRLDVLSSAFPLLHISPPIPQRNPGSQKRAQVFFCI